jgi:hypothetical protein
MSKREMTSPHTFHLTDTMSKSESNIAPFPPHTEARKRILKSRRRRAAAERRIEIETEAKYGK